VNVLNWNRPLDNAPLLSILVCDTINHYNIGAFFSPYPPRLPTTRTSLAGGLTYSINLPAASNGVSFEELPQWAGYLPRKRIKKGYEIMKKYLLIDVLEREIGITVHNTRRDAFEAMAAKAAESLHVDVQSIIAAVDTNGAYAKESEYDISENDGYVNTDDGNSDWQIHEIDTDDFIDCTQNHKEHRAAMSALSVTELIRAVDYIHLLSQFLAENNEALDDLKAVIAPFEDVIQKLQTGEPCRHSECNREMYKSDLAQYDYVCPDCDENF
jgi:hypothetical protein